MGACGYTPWQTAWRTREPARFLEWKRRHQTPVLKLFARQSSPDHHGRSPVLNIYRYRSNNGTYRDSQIPKQTIQIAQHRLGPPQEARDAIFVS